MKKNMNMSFADKIWYVAGITLNWVSIIGIYAFTGLWVLWVLRPITKRLGFQPVKFGI